MIRPILALLFLTSLAICGETDAPVRPKHIVISDSKAHVLGALASTTVEGEQIILDGDGSIDIAIAYVMPSGTRIQRHLRVPADRSKPIFDRVNQIADRVPQAIADDVSRLWRDVNALLEVAAKKGQVSP
jgi:hypothetical protein